MTDSTRDDIERTAERLSDDTARLNFLLETVFRPGDRLGDMTVAGVERGEVVVLDGRRRRWIKPLEALRLYRPEQPAQEK